LQTGARTDARIRKRQHQTMRISIIYKTTELK
jgi:hypothetical protein